MFQELPLLKELQTYYPQEAEKLKEHLSRARRKTENSGNFKDVQAQVQLLASQDLEKILAPKIIRASNQPVGEYASLALSFVKKNVEKDPQAKTDLFSLALCDLRSISNNEPGRLVDLLTKLGRVVESSALSPQPPPTQEAVQAASKSVFGSPNRVFEKYDSSLKPLLERIKDPKVHEELEPGLVKRFKIDVLNAFAAAPVEELGLLVRNSYYKKHP